MTTPEVDPWELAGFPGRLDEGPAQLGRGRDIVSKLQTAIPDLLLWRYSLTPAEQPRYEEQDLELLLRDLRA